MPAQPRKKETFICQAIMSFNNAVTTQNFY